MRPSGFAVYGYPSAARQAQNQIRTRRSIRVGEMYLNVEVHVLAQAGCFHEVLQLELPPSATFAGAAKQLTERCALLRQLRLLATHVIERHAKFSDSFAD